MVIAVIMAIMLASTLSLIPFTRQMAQWPLNGGPVQPHSAHQRVAPSLARAFPGHAVTCSDALREVLKSGHPCLILSPSSPRRANRGAASRCDAQGTAFPHHVPGIQPEARTRRFFGSFRSALSTHICLELGV